MYKKMVLISLLFVLFIVNGVIYQKEQQLRHGKLLYLKLAPVDPRSLMQGDYMALHFALADKIYTMLPKNKEQRGWQNYGNHTEGYVVVALDKKRIASFVRFYQKNEPLQEGELLIEYRVRNGVVKLASNAYFFQEGTAKRYENAQYGVFRASPEGEILLVAMADKDVKPISIPTE